MVERYSASSIMWGLDGLPIHPKPNGEWVRYSDYAALDAQLAELAVENERLKQEVENWRTSAAGWQKIANVDAEALTVAQEAGKP